MPGRLGQRWAWLVGLLVGGAALALAWQSPWFKLQVPSPPTVAAAGVDAGLVAAVEAARGDVRRSPDSASLWGRLGLLLLAHDYKTQAAVCFTQATVLDRQSADWPYYRGMSLVDAQPELAVVHFQQALKVAGPAAYAMNLRLADTFLALDRLDEARAQYLLVAQAEPANARAQLGLARVAMRRLQPAVAVALLERLQNDPHTRKAALGLLAQARQMLGDGDAAARLLREAAQAEADQAWSDPWAQRLAQHRLGKNAEVLRAHELFRQQRMAEGIAVTRKALETYPDDGYLWFALGKAYYQGKELALAEQAVRKALVLEPQSVQATFLLAVVLGEQGDLAGAKQHFRAATELRPEFALGHFNLALCLAREGDRAGAVQAFRRAIKADPAMFKAHLGAAELLVAQGLNDQALDHAKQALQLKPDNDDARVLIGRLQRPSGVAASAAKLPGR